MRSLRVSWQICKDLRAASLDKEEPRREKSPRFALGFFGWHHGRSAIGVLTGKSERRMK
jgi:hypothetical protein